MIPSRAHYQVNLRLQVKEEKNVVLQDQDCVGVSRKIC